MKAFMLDLIGSVDDIIAKETPVKRVVTLLISLVAFGFSAGMGVASWVGLPSDVRENTSTINALADNQKYMVRLITSLECDRKEMGNVDCRRLQFQRVQNLRSSDENEEGKEQ